MRTSKSWHKTAMLAAAFTLAGGAVVLYLMRGNIDPRFYRFLASRPGKAVASIMGWSVDFELPPTDVPEEEMTEEEIAIKRMLEDRIQFNRPRHRLTLKNGEILVGRVVAYSDKTVTFMERYGESGEMAIQIRRSRIAGLTEPTAPVPQITDRDIQLYQSFPDFEFHRIPPFSAITDDNYFRAQKSVRLLQRLHRQFLAVFGPVITRPERGGSIQLVFFREEKDFQRYAEDHAPRLEHSSGFYSPQLDRLIVFNQITSDKLREAKRALKRQERLYRRQAKTAGEQQRVKIWRSDAARSIARHAELQTEYTVRHEGSHQLFFTYGVHSTHHAENSWLIEGLSVYCEGQRLGDRLPERVAMIKQHLGEDSLISLVDLVNSRSALGLFVFGNEERVHLAYAEAWAAVQFLMQPKYRDLFFDYIRIIREPQNIDTLSRRPRIDVLAETMHMTRQELERGWQLYLRRL